MKNYVLVSVSDKSNILKFVEFLFNKDYYVLSTEAHLDIYMIIYPFRERLEQVSDFTGFPEILGGRVKTLHPKIYGGLLWDNKFNMEGITKIDMIVVNLILSKRL